MPRPYSGPGPAGSSTVGHPASPFAAGRDPARTRLREVMTAEPATIEADAPVLEAILHLDADGLRHLVVVEGERVPGVLSNRDIPVLELGNVAEELHEQRRAARRLGNGSAAYA